MPKFFSVEQIEYKEAQRNLDMLVRMTDAPLTALLDTYSKEEFDKDVWVDTYIAKEIELRKELGIPQAEKRLREAEEALVTWGVNYLKNQPTYDPVIEEMCKSPAYRSRAIPLLLRIMVGW